MSGTTLKQLINKTGKYFSIGVGLLTIDSYIRDVKNNKLLENYNKVVDRNRLLEDKFNKLLENKISTEETKIKIVEALVKRKESLDIVRDEINSIKEINKSLEIAVEEETRNNIISEINSKINNLSQNINFSNNKLSEIIDTILNNNSGEGSNSMFIDQINYFIIAYKNFLDTLTLMQKGAIAHISMSFFILFCLFSLIGIFYGDSLIRHLRLEDRFPKLARFIQIRRKFQQYYFFLNTLFIILALFTIIYINILVFIYL